MPNALEADEISRNLWQGSYPEPGRVLADAGYTMLVLCAHEHQDHPDVFPGVQVVHAPNFDDGGIDPLPQALFDTAVRAAQLTELEIVAGGRVLVTCRMGMNRSGLVTALALHYLYGWDGPTCIHRVRSFRKAPNGYYPLSNSEFVRVLKTLPARAPNPSRR